MRIVCWSLTEDAAKTMVHAFVTTRIDYCNSVIRSSNVVHILPLQNALNAAARLVLFDYCRRSGSFTLAITSAAGGVQGKFIDLQVPPSSSSIISGWDVRSSRLSNRQPMSPPLHNTWRPGSSMNQIGKIPKKFLCVWSAPVELTTTVKTFSSAWLSSVHDWRLFCFPEPIGHHSTSVTVSVVKFVCTNINLLIYFAQCALLYIVQILWCSCVSGRVLMWMYCGWIYVQFGTAVGLC